MSNGLRGTRRLAATAATIAGTIALAAAALLGTAHSASAATAASHGVLTPGNPARSMAPATSLLTSCSAGANDTSCNQLALTAIGQARHALEKLGGMRLNVGAYQRLTTAQQLFVVVNLERTARGLAPAAVLSKSLNRVAQAGAQTGRDPSMGSVPRQLPGGARTAYAGSVWSGGWINPLGADYAWMYDDGPGGSNLDCTAANATGCWGHRDVLLTRFTSASCHGGTAQLTLGAGHAARAGAYAQSDTVLLTASCGHAATDAAFTWAKAKKLLGIR